MVKPSGGNDDLICERGGQSIPLKTTPTNGPCSGVRGMRLKTQDTITGMDLITDGKADSSEQLLVVMAHGHGKRTPIKEYRIQGRGGSGTKAAKITEKTGSIVSAFIVNAKREGEDVIVISDRGQVIRLPLKSVSVLGRDTQGVRLMRFKEEKDEVASVTFV